MNSKDRILKMLKNEFDGWEELLAGLNGQQLVVPLHPSTLSVKDVVAHLHTWQQVSIARAEAALLEKAPVYPKWPAGLDRDSDDDLDQINAWIYETHREQAWPDVYQAWRKGFLRFLEIGQAIPEVNMFSVDMYPWMEGYTLSQVFIGSYEHHQEHREPIHDWFHKQG